MNVCYRPPTTDDAAFIMSAWLSGQRKQGDRVFMTNDVYYDGEKKRVTQLLSRARVVIICEPEEPSHIFGFLAYSNLTKADLFILHYAHLKKPYRKLGIMKALIGELFPRAGRDEIAITHVNETMWKIMGKYKLKYSPFLEGYL